MRTVRERHRKPQDKAGMIAKLEHKRSISPSGCWEWQGGKNSKTSTYAYGQVRFLGRPYQVHRISAWCYGILKDLSSNDWVLHKCDNTICFNPDHLFLGSAKDNTQDNRMKDRNIGRKCLSGANLRADDVRKIKLLIKTRHNLKFIAKEFGTSYHNIYMIKTGQAWEHLTE